MDVSKAKVPRSYLARVSRGRRSQWKNICDNTSSVLSIHRRDRDFVARPLKVVREPSDGGGR